MLKAGVDVVVCGSLHLDIVVHALTLPHIDETAVGSAWQQVCGGKGGNQAVQAARAGACTAMIGRVGQDEFGKLLLANLANTGVDATGVSVDSESGSGMSVAIIQKNGDYGAVIVSGSNLAIDTLELPKQWLALGGGKVLILQNEVPHDVNVTMAKTARTHGTIVIFNAAPARDLRSDLLDLVDVLIVNRVEAASICGMPVYDRASARKAIAGLQSARRSIVITLGGDGLVLSTPSGEVVEIEPIAVEVKSTHGAGDCFVGALAAHLAAGHSLVAACNMANAAAAKHVASIR
jgi:ribokinase